LLPYFCDTKQKATEFSIALSFLVEHSIGFYRGLEEDNILSIYHNGQIH